MRRWNKVIFLGVTCLALAGCGKDRGDELVKDYQKNDELAVESLQKVTAMGQNLWKWMRHI